MEPTGVDTNTETCMSTHTCTRTAVHVRPEPHAMLADLVQQKLIIKWFCFLHLIPPSIWQVQSLSFIVIQACNWLAFTADTLSLSSVVPATTDAHTRTHAHGQSHKHTQAHRRTHLHTRRQTHTGTRSTSVTCQA